MSEHLVTDPSLPEFIFVVGGPGAGKGTQCSLLAKKYGFWHFSLGNILRAEASITSSKWGDIIRNNIQEGAVGSKEMTVDLLRNAIGGVLALCDPKYILIDGFPRSLDRAQFFEEELGVPLCVLLLECSDNTMRQRLHSRAETEGRSDDNHQAIDKRIAALHHDNTTQVLGYYAQSSKLVTVDGSKSQLDVLASVELGLGQYLRLVPSGSVDRELSETVTRKRKRTASE